MGEEANQNPKKRKPRVTLRKVEIPVSGRVKKTLVLKRKKPEVRLKPSRKKKAQLLEHVPENALAILDLFKLVPKQIKKRRRFSKHDRVQHVYFSESYNLLQYFNIAKRYVLAKYGYPRFEYIEIFLYLYPKNFFAFEDYKNFPMPLAYRSIESMLKRGHLVYYIRRRNKMESLYCLSDTAKAAVEDFYNVLAGNKALDIEKFYKDNEHFRKKSKLTEMTIDFIKTLEGEFDFHEQRKIYYKEVPNADNHSPESD